MTKKVRLQKEAEYSDFLGKEWSQTRGGGCFTLLYEFGIAKGIHTCKEDYSFTAKEFLKDLWEDEGWSAIKTSTMGEVFDIDDLQLYDLLLMKFDKRMNHCAVYIGDGYILHHRAFDISRIEAVESYISKTLYVIRKNA